MNRLATIRAAIAAVLTAVPGIGRVHQYERYAREPADFSALFLNDQPDGTQQLRGWWFRRTETEERSVNTIRTLQIDTWTVRGYMALNDAEATELAFDDLVEAFRDAVRDDPTFGGVCQMGPLSGDDNTDNVQVADAGPVIFCGVLCHSAVLQLRTWSYQ